MDKIKIGGQEFDVKIENPVSLQENPRVEMPNFPTQSLLAEWVGLCNKHFDENIEVAKKKHGKNIGIPNYTFDVRKKYCEKVVESNGRLPRGKLRKNLVFKNCIPVSIGESNNDPSTHEVVFQYDERPVFS